MGFLVPALAGYIAFAIADRPGIAPGFVAGAVAVLMSSGFIGGHRRRSARRIRGPVVRASCDVPRWLRGLMPVVIIPLIASIVASGILILFLGRPIATLMAWLNVWLNDLAATGAIVVVGVILGIMMCFDLGGPINKVAYAFAVAGLAAGSESNQTPYLIMSAVMCAGMVPPLAMALASTVLARDLFPPVERENGKAAWLLGAAFICEGAIPFAAADPLRVIPACMVGGAVTGGLSMAFGVTSLAPHGGIFVLFAINPIWGFLVALAAGTVVTGTRCHRAQALGRSQGAGGGRGTVRGRRRPLTSPRTTIEGEQTWQNAKPPSRAVPDCTPAPRSCSSRRCRRSPCR